MPRIDILVPKFIHYMPEKSLMEEGMLYISREFEVAIHKCCCGCGQETVMPFGTHGWTLTEQDGKVTFSPSIGNFQIPCRSHYWIKDNRVIWC